MSNAKIAAAFFNFADLSDLPEELGAKLTSDTDGAAREYAAIVVAGADAGYPSLQIAQIMAVAIRMNAAGALEVVPTENTVRNYLNRAVRLKLISKPTRASYGPFNAAAPVEPEDEAAPVADPLAGI